MDTAPDSAEVRTLMGLLHERLGEHHAAYQCYRLALMLDRHDPSRATACGDIASGSGTTPGTRRSIPCADRSDEIID